jgi:hypothetical protein
VRIAATLFVCLALARPASAEVMTNGGPLPQMAAAPLATESLAMLPGLVEAVQHDPATRTFVHHLVECALEADQRVTLPTEPEPTTFEGAFALAPAWADGPCDEECQEWVSACMLARANAYGIPVIIHARGTHPALAASAEDLARFPVEEGAFYGNLFTDPPREYACRGAGDDALSLTFRACTLPGARCGIQVVGPCDLACEGVDPANGGAHTACRNRARPDAGAAWPEPSRRYARVVTVYLRRHTLAPAADALPCDAAPGDDAPPPERPRAPAPAAGAQCDNDDDCADGALVCDARPPGGFCTAACVPSLDRLEEQAACGGPGTTCLNASSGPYCTSTCTPGGGDCAPGQICSGFWFLQPEARPDVPGCYPYCAGDADCPPTTFCNPRHGGCGAPVDMAALPDGEPCALPAEGNGPPEVPCRGGCLRVGADPTQGICGSLWNTAVSNECPDDPAHIAPLTKAGDEIGVCVFRKCQSDEDCTAPLRCRGGRLPGQTRRCEYPPP